MRLLIVSNRLPITIEEQESGELLIKQSVGGLVSGISDYLSRLKFSEFLKPDYVWIGFSGIDVDSKQKEKLSKKLFQHYNAWPVFLSKRVVDKFYHGFCNKILWPLFHSFPSYVEWNDEYWQTYIDVNKIFAQEILKIAKEDDIIWIHDYHLMLLPSMLRKEIDNAKIIFSLHIPFPHFEIFQLLPKAWRTGLLKGLLGADIVGFHTYEYSQNFLQSVLRFLGYQNEMGKILTDEGLVKVGTFPMGINFQKFHFALEDQEILSKVETLKEKFKNYKVILSIDRLDYTKGILNRLKAYEQFLKDNPQYFDKVVLIIVVVPGRVGVERYQKTKNEIDEYVGKINGEFGNIEWTPVIYQTKFLPFEDLAVFYNIADVMLVSPLRDGMNLIAKEYVASKKDAKGVLILSEMAGAAKELTEAILVNPYDISEIASAIKEALEMPVEEQTRRNKIMQNRLRKYDIARWGDELIKELLSIKDEQNKFSTKLLVPRLQEKLYSEYKKAERRLILLDYDGTLVPFVASPPKAQPDEELLNLLMKLTDDAKNEVVLLSGRDKETLEKWFSTIGINLVAEHGVWIKEKHEKDWKIVMPLRSDWKGQILPIISTYVDRLPGSFIEEKEFSVAWHYRKSDPEQSSLVVKDAIEYLISFTANLDIQILQGEKIVEIRCGGVNKGSAALYWLSKNNFDFILGIGDDLTDEDLFKALPEEAYTIKVRIGPSNAKFNLYDYSEVRKLLWKLGG